MGRNNLQQSQQQQMNYIRHLKNFFAKKITTELILAIATIVLLVLLFFPTISIIPKKSAPRKGSMNTSIERSKFIGKTIIIGVTYLDSHENVAEKREMHGVIVDASKKGVSIELSSREMFHLPPDLTALHPAPPGEYRFRSTGEVVVNPDFMTEWTIYPPK